jgi:hypothetical protein
MAEYLYPGVYVVETASGSKAIEGVPTSTASFVDSRALLQRLSNLLPPDWTEENESDPGIALLALSAWLAEMVVHRAERLPERGVMLGARIAAAVLTLMSEREQPQGSVLTNVRFFAGQLLNADDLRIGVDYRSPQADSNARQRLCFGIVCGLEVNVNEDGDSPSLNVAPGYALNKEGRAIVLAERIALPLPATLHSAAVIARRKCCAAASIILIHGLACEVLVVDEPKEDDLTLSRLEKTSEGWRVTRPSERSS